MGVHDGHRKRLEKRFLENGIESFEAVNVLELLLFFTHKRCDTNEIAHALLERFDTFSGVLDAPYDMLLEVPGIGPASASLLKLVQAITGFYMNDRVDSCKIINSTQSAGRYFVPRFIGKRNEEVHVLLLDDKNKILRCTKLFEGTVNMAPITVKKVISEVVATNATGVILAHNHPGGLALPSANDKRATAQLCQALGLINVRFIDHIIVAENDYVSMADSGMLSVLR
ncbi:MAG: DNA repair protein RadC [Pygmaiobacter sp.]